MLWFKFSSSHAPSWYKSLSESCWIFLPLQMAIHLFSWPSLPKHSLVLVEELTNRVGRNISFIYLIVEAGGQGTEQGFKVWVDGDNFISVCSSIRSSCVLKVGELFGVLLAGWPYIWVWRGNSRMETKHVWELFERQSWREQSRNSSLLNSLLLSKYAF